MFTHELPDHVVCDESDLRGLRSERVELLAVGGGLACFSLIDLLRVCGVPTSALAVLGRSVDPAENFRRLALHSGIGPNDRLRSDSAARVDNVWGFPGYALSEARSRRRLRPLGTVLGEPLISEYYTPRAGAVYAGIAREAARIGWARMHRRGLAHAVRPHVDGDLVVFAADADGDPVALRARYVHLGLGHAGLGLSAPLRDYREHVDASERVVHGYEAHEHVYRRLRTRGGTAVVTGAGITAARVVERLLSERGPGPEPLRVVHVVRPNPTRRAAVATAGDPWRRQAFSFPKSAAGGPLAWRIATCTQPAERAALLAAAGAASAPVRREWSSQLADARQEGSYRPVVGTVTTTDPSADGRARVRIATDGGIFEVCADAVIECTGLHPDPRSHPLIDDLLTTGLARTNASGRLAVDESFEVREARLGAGRLYATGALTAGNALGPVDSFWGLQAAAVRVVDDLARLGFTERLGVRRSTRAWLRWVLGNPP